MVKRATLSQLGVMVSFMIVTGCSLPFLRYGENGLSQDQFADYVESVFRLQNSVTSELMLLDSDERQTVLLQAEQMMRTDCAALNEYATRDSDGLTIGLALSRRVAQSVAQCEKAALHLKLLLEYD